MVRGPEGAIAELDDVVMPEMGVCGVPVGHLSFLSSLVGADGSWRMRRWMIILGEQRIAARRNWGR